MSYTALYRRLRPKSFKDVIGQNHIVKTLSNQIESGRITHAYLFCGTRGTGKTSMAKIFAKAINCMSPIKGSPCNECDLCKNIEEGRSMNVIEIDAASNNGVDNIREIREEVKYPPTEGKYKVYIIDEVHMLSLGAFNALLKTLEEPPEHVVFILATTDPQKIPVTILSRCQRFDFKRISSYDMIQTLKRYMEEEKVDIDDDAIKYIAGVSDGAMRDALSILDQCIAFYFDEKITLEKVLETIGSVDKQVFFEITDALISKDIKRCFEIIEEIVLKGRDINQFLAEFIEHLRNLLISISVNDNSNALDFSAENIEKLKEQSKKFDMRYLIKLINDFSELQGKMKFLSNPRVLLEIGYVKACNPIEENSFDSIFERLSTLEKLAKNGMIYNKNENLNIEKEPKEIKRPPIKEKALPEDIKNVIDNWSGFSDSFEMSVKSFIQLVTPGYLENNFLYIVCKDLSYLKYINDKIDLINNKLSEYFGKQFEMRTILSKDYDLEHKKIYGTKDENLNKDDLNKSNPVKKIEEAFNYTVTVE